MSQRSDQKARTRQRILDTAVALFAANGIAATKTADIAKGAGVSHGAVFVHFATRDELVKAVVGTFARELTDQLYALARTGGGLRAALRLHLESIGANEALYTHLAAEAATLPEEARHAWIGLQSAIGYHFSETAERAMAAKTIKRCEFPLLFNTWLGLLHHYLINRELFAPAGSVIDRWGDALLDHFMKLVCTDDS